MEGFEINIHEFFFFFATLISVFEEPEVQIGILQILSSFRFIAHRSMLSVSWVSTLNHIVPLVLFQAVLSNIIPG